MFNKCWKCGKRDEILYNPNKAYIIGVFCRECAEELDPEGMVKMEIQEIAENIRPPYDPKYGSESKPRWESTMRMLAAGLEDEDHIVITLHRRDKTYRRELFIGAAPWYNYKHLFCLVESLQRTLVHLRYVERKTNKEVT